MAEPTTRRVDARFTQTLSWPGMRSEYSWLPPHDDVTVTKPNQVGVSFSQHRRVLVVGAAGRFAGAVVPELVKRGARVRALVRDGARAEVARRRGARETVVADLADPATLPGAVHGVDGVFHIGPAFHPREAELGVAMVAAAREAGVGRSVFSGVIHPSISAMVNHAAKQPVEEALYTSGMAFTVLQPAMYLQGLDTLWPEVVVHSRLTLPYSVTAKVCWVDYRDVAEVAARALTRDDLAYGTFELSAPGLVDRVEMAAIIG